MTLLEMITKWERVKDSLKGKPGVSVVNEVLEDLRSTITQPSWVDIRRKILTMVDKAISHDDPDGALTWTNVLSMLPKENYPYAK